MLHLHELPVNPATDVVGRTDDGLAVFRRHFARSRPLITTTALGTAAGVHTLVAEALAAKTRVSLLPRVWDSALVVLGRTHAETTAALLAALTTSRLAADAHPHADFAAGSARPPASTPPYGPSRTSPCRHTDSSAEPGTPGRT
ncbi:hypothetical protein V6U90_16245 [Micromonospora sp. CPCC 206060]|uniref:hypothetical protein n=1 Tax=Micromonospora sp. CPCC 206060 TaxID=3122406 RepID=UPI002FF1DCCC